MTALREAAKKLQNGFCKHQLKDGDGKYCTTGALSSALGLEPLIEFRNSVLSDKPYPVEVNDVEVYRFVGNSVEGQTLAEVIVAEYPNFEGYGDAADIIWGFNDVPGRRVEDIVAMLEKADACLDERVEV